MSDVPYLGQAEITPEMGAHDGEYGKVYACRVHVKIADQFAWTSPWKMLSATTEEDAYVEGNAEIDLWLMRLNEGGVEFTRFEDNR